MGYEFSSRSAARAEALAAIRDLSHRGEPRRWAGWFLRVADAEGEFLCLPMGHPALAIVPDRASELDRGLRPTLHVHALVSSLEARRRVSPGGTDFNSAWAQPRRSRPRLTVLPGGR